MADLIKLDLMNATCRWLTNFLIMFRKRHMKLR